MKPLEYMCILFLLKFDGPIAQQFFRHSNAHTFEEAMERIYGKFMVILILVIVDDSEICQIFFKSFLFLYNSNQNVHAMSCNAQ